MWKVEELMSGPFKIRSIKDREGDLDYFIDNEGRPLVFRYKAEMQFFKVSTILLRVGQGEMCSLHFLLERDLLSAMAFIEVNGTTHELIYEVQETHALLTMKERR